MSHPNPHISPGHYCGPRCARICWPFDAVPCSTERCSACARPHAERPYLLALPRGAGEEIRLLRSLGSGSRGAGVGFGLCKAVVVTFGVRVPGAGCRRVPGVRCRAGMLREVETADPTTTPTQRANHASATIATKAIDSPLPVPLPAASSPPPGVHRISSPYPVGQGEELRSRRVALKRWGLLERST